MTQQGFQPGDCWHRMGSTGQLDARRPREALCKVQPLRPGRRVRVRGVQASDAPVGSALVAEHHHRFREVPIRQWVLSLPFAL